MAREVVGEAIDLLNQGHPAEARALLMALRSRFFTGAGAFNGARTADRPPPRTRHRG
jgi:hypothetical protein